MTLLSKIQKEYGGFKTISSFVGSEKLDEHCDKIYHQYCTAFKDASYLVNIEWLLRNFNASKKMALSALFYTQTEYFHGHNINNISFYTMYYSLFNAFSSNALMFPQLKLSKVTQISHAQIFKIIENYLIRHEVYDESFTETLNELRLMREAYSYHLPLGGTFLKEENNLNFQVLFNKLGDLLPIVFQLTDLYSYLAHYAWDKKVGKALDEYSEYKTQVDEMFFSFIETNDHLGKYCLVDEEDYRRQGYVLRKWDTPFPISWFIIDKLCEDLECGWEETEDQGYEITSVAHYLSDVIHEK